ncbi:MAG: insulinase family protein, partial [Verrucomicrobiae bacterium]|nr:insulinase family protein [Verrucomicrobiae bacterium]
VAMQGLREALFGAAHPYGLRPSGSRQSVAALQREPLAHLLSETVVGQNGVVAVFGDIDASQAEELLRQRFETALPRGQAAFSGRPVGPDFPSLGGDPIELHHDKEQAILLVGFRTGGIATPERASLDLLDEACSDMASRVFIRIREDLGLAYSVGATQLIGLDTGLFVFYVATSPQQLDLVQSELLDEIDLLRREGLEAEEFQRAKNSFLGREIMGRQSAQQLASQTAVDELLGLGWDHFRQVPDTIRGLQRDMIQATAAEAFSPERRAIVRLTRK